MENLAYLNQQLITYLGNKRQLLSLIAHGLGLVRSKLGKRKLKILDGFSGSGMVSRGVKRYAELLIANDVEYYAALLSRCYLTNASTVDQARLQEIAADFDARKLTEDLPPGFMARLYAPQVTASPQQDERCYFTAENARIIDNLCRMILTEVPDEKHLFLGPLLSQVTRQANTAGHFGAFYKNKEGVGQFGGPKRQRLEKICKEITQEAPVLSHYECDVEVHQRDINELVKELDRVDVAYLDPPYNHQAYGKLYFMLNVVAHYEEPQNISKVCGIPPGWQRSDYYRKRQIKTTLTDLVRNVNATFVLLSFSNDGFISLEEMMEILSAEGRVQVLDQEHAAVKGGRSRHQKRMSKVTERLYLLEKSA